MKAIKTSPTNEPSKVTLLIQLREKKRREGGREA
jgi:hypothetical protein